jgi:SPP1 family predicted phage head-tail adaptor
MTIGELRDRVTLEQPVTAADGQGGRVVTGTTTLARNVAANVQPAGAGAEQLQAAAVRAVVRYVVTLRYRADVSVGMRLQWTPYRSTTSRTLQVHATRAADRRWLVLDASEVQS